MLLCNTFPLPPVADCASAAEIAFFIPGVPAADCAVFRTDVIPSVTLALSTAVVTAFIFAASRILKSLPSHLVF